MAQIKNNLVSRTKAHQMTLLAPFVSVEVPEQCFEVLSYSRYRL